MCWHIRPRMTRNIRFTVTLSPHQSFWLTPRARRKLLIVSLSHQCTRSNRPIVRMCVVREYCLGAKELYYVMRRKSTTLTSFHFGRFPGCLTHQLGFTIRVQDCHRIHPQNPTIPPHHSLPQCRCSRNSLKFSKYGISFSYSSYSK